MICAGCGEKNRDGARYCTFCGVTLGLQCSVCDTELVAGARFCDSCGTPVRAQPDEPAPAARKVVTVLFSDLTGSTALEERMDAESVRTVLDRFYATQRTQTERYGGRVVKFTGDGVMAVFGVPDVREDDAARAVDAALSMRAECELLAADLGLPLALKIGVNTGEVVVSETDEDVVGDCVNVAARLEGAATSGEILVGEETWRLTRSTSRYETIAPLSLKGKSEPVPAYRLMAVDERTADSAAAPFVGRQRELERLVSLFGESVEDRSARVATIIGSPGLGKTRLTRELMARLSADARVRETRCDPAGSATFAPIADTLRGAASIPDSASEQEVVAALLAFLPEDVEERDRIAERAAAILGVGHAGSTEETFWAVRRLIESAAGVEPVVLVIDDIHWAEPLLLDLIEHLGEWIKDAPVLIVCTARPELRDIRPSLTEGGRAAAVVALEGLDAKATALLALNLLETDELPDELLAKIPASTEGNPLFVRELVRMLVDDGVLLRTGDGWSVTVDVEAIQVPPTIQSLLAARVDRLRPDERTFLEIAAVVGKEFYRGPLYELAPATIRDQLDACLESLRRKELVEPAGTYWIDEPVYRFHHVLIRDAAYRRILKEARAELHEQVAEWLERKTEDVLGEYDELIGYHVEQAHENRQQLGTTDDVLGSRAAALLGGAARRALDSDDLPAAAALSGRALVRLPVADPSRPEVLLVRCEALLSMGDVAAAGAAFEEFAELADTPRLAAWATCFEGQLATFTSSERLQETEKHVAAAATQLTELGDPAGAAKAHTVHATVLARLGRFAACEAVLDLALNAARAADDRRRITAVLGAAPHAALWGPSPVSRAGGRCLDIVRLLRITTGSPAVEATSLRCQAVLEAFRGRADAARRMLGSARRTLTELGLNHELLETEQFAGVVDLVSGDAVGAKTHLRAARDGFRAVGVEVLAAQSAAMLARAHLMLGELEDAERFADESEALGGQDLKASIAWRAVKAELLARRGAFDEARALATSAVEFAERTDALIDHGDARRALAAVCSAAGDAAAARSARDRATALYEQKGATALFITAEANHAYPVVPVTIAGSSVLENACTRLGLVWSQVVERRDWEAFATLWAADCVIDDRRAGLSHVFTGREAMVESTQMIADLGVERIERVVIAIRGDRLAVSELSFTGTVDGGVYAVPALGLTEVDRSGRFSSVVFFDLHDLPSAIDELEARYSAEAGDTHASGMALLRVLNNRDWDGFRALLADDIVVVDHRPASLGVLNGPDGYIAAVAGLVQVIPDLYTYVSAIHVMDERGEVVEYVARGTTVEGTSVETSFYGLNMADANGALIARAEWFPLDQVDQALARYAELTADEIAPRKDPQPADRSVAPSNDCTRAMQAFARSIEDADWDACKSILAEDTSVEDRRPGLGSRVSGRDARLDHLRAMTGSGADRFRYEPFAVRGSNLALARVRVEGGAQESSTSVVEALSLDELGASGALSASMLFGVDDLDSAYVELDERYLCSEVGAPYAEAVCLMRDSLRALSDGDWERYGALLSDDFHLVDRRPVSLGERRGREAEIQTVRGLGNVVTGLRYYCVANVAMAPDCCVAELVATGMTPEDGAVEFRYYAVPVLRDGRIARLDLFDIGQLDEAIARFEEVREEAQPAAEYVAQLISDEVEDEMGRQPPREVARDTLVLENEATRVARATSHAMLRDDWDAVRSALADDLSLDDRRNAVSSAGRGPDAYVNNFKTVRGLGFNGVREQVIAIRGERLALMLGELFDSEGNVMSGLVVSEVDADGRMTACVYFDPDDLHPALTELEQRYFAGEGAPFADWAAIDDFRWAHADRDWERMASHNAPDVVMVDHRPASFGRIEGNEAYVSYFRAMTELVNDMTMYPSAIHRISPRHILVTVVARGSTNEGAPVELISHSVGVRDSRGNVLQEVFGEDQIEAALQRFDELAEPESWSPTNACVENWRRATEVYENRDWARYGELISEDLRFEDRRSGLGVSLQGVESFVEQMKVIADMGPVVESEVIATRGNDAMLMRVRWHDPSGRSALEVEALHVHRLDGSDRLSSVVIFDPEELAAAYAELDRRLTLTNRSSRVAERMLGAYRARDWQAAAACYAANVLCEVRRQGLQAAWIGPDAQVEQLQAVAEIGGDTIDTEVIATRGERLDLMRGALGDLDDVLTLHELNDHGALMATVTFDPHDLDAALAELDERYLHGDGAPYGEMVGSQIRATSAYNARDWEAYADAFRSDVALIDHRSAGAGTITGRVELMRYLRTLVDIAPDTRLRTVEIVGIAPDMTLRHMQVAGAGEHGAHVELSFYICEIFEGTCCAAIEVFPVDRRHDAERRFAELHAFRSRQGI